LSWRIILQKRDHYRQVFDHFDPYKIAEYDDAKVQALLADAGIIRNRLKIRAAIENARCFIAIQREFGSFDRFIWTFVDGRVQQNAWQSVADIPATSPVSEAMSKELKRRGFRFVGPTICYAFMQAVGMVNDHIVTCFRYAELSNS
ncbi:MAG: DNA-3-methyladenine glycosylase I, partial [Chloroflexi bacterium]|nr:DNA-3-methyladenine glycosylase I [Chloroflexota bacterium]